MSVSLDLSLRSGPNGSSAAEDHKRVSRSFEAGLEHRDSLWTAL